MINNLDSLKDKPEEIYDHIPSDKVVEEKFDKYKTKHHSVKLSLVINELLDEGYILTKTLIFNAQRKKMGIWSVTPQTVYHKLEQLSSDSKRIVLEDGYSQYVFTK